MDNSSIFAIFATSFGTLLWYSYKRDQKKALLEEIKSSQVFSPEALLNIFKNIDRHQPSRLKPQASSQNPNEYKIKAFVEGSVACDKPIESQAYKDVQLVHRVAYKEDIYSNARLVEGTNVQFAPKRDIEIEAPLYFYLKDPFTQDICKVHRSMQAETNALEEISVRQITRDLSLFEKGLVYLGLSFEFMRAAMNLTMLTRGIKIGWSEKELGIKIGSTLTVYGEVIYNAVEGKLRIDSPLFYVLEKRNVIDHFKKKLDGLDTIKGMLLVPVIISFYFLMKRLWNSYSSAANVQAMKKVDKLWQVTAVKLKDDYKCIKCMKKPRNVIMQPCQDLCLCKGCYDEMESGSSTVGGSSSKACPICNEPIKDGVEIYFT